MVDGGESVTVQAFDPDQLAPEPHLDATALFAANLRKLHDHTLDPLAEPSECQGKPALDVIAQALGDLDAGGLGSEASCKASLRLQGTKFEAPVDRIGA